MLVESRGNRFDPAPLQGTRRPSTDSSSNRHRGRTRRPCRTRSGQAATPRTFEQEQEREMSEKTLKMIKDNDVRWVDLRFTDPKGKEQHTTIPAGKLDAD